MRRGKLPNPSLNASSTNAFKIPKYQNTRTPEHQNTKNQKTKIPKYQNTKVWYFARKFWIFGYLKRRIDHSKTQTFKLHVERTDSSHQNSKP